MNFGFLAKALFNFSEVNKLMQLVIGLICLLIIGHLWAFFWGFGILFHVLLLLSNGFISWKFQKEIISFFKGGINQILAFSIKYKILLLCIFLLILAKSASQGSRLDNENYYIQTIKWLNEFGFVNGLANLHLFFGQTSGWHVLQSIFSFEFINFDFNDLSSFLLLILNVYALKDLKQHKANSILLGLPIFNFFLLEFTIVPSPDFGIIVFSLMTFYTFLASFKKPLLSDFYLVLLCAFSAMLIKVTAIGLLVLPVVLLFKLKNISFSIWVRIFSLGLLFLGVLVAKNLIISGYPFFPSQIFSEYIGFKHKIPQGLYDFSLRREKLYEFFASVDVVRSSSNFELFWKWLSRSKISFIFNVSLILSIFLIPFGYARYKLNSKYWWIYISFLAQIIFLALTSPQYRFAIHYLIFFLLIFFVNIVRNQSFRFTILAVSQLIVIYFLVFPIPFDKISAHKFQLNSADFKLKNVVIPAPNSSIQSAYKTNQTGNMEYLVPVEKVYFWSNGDCDLPCVNNIQLKYIFNKTNLYPQLIDSTRLEKGFYSKTYKP